MASQLCPARATGVFFSSAPSFRSRSTTKIHATSIFRIGRQGSSPTLLMKGPAPRQRLVIASAQQGEDEDVKAEDLPPPNCERVKIQLRKPLGMTLEDNAAGDIFVVGLVAGGNAEKSAKVDVGDQLIAVTGMVYNNTQDYGGVSVKGGEQIVRVAVRGEKFNTVMAAVGSIPGQIPVQIELQKCVPLNE